MHHSHELRDCVNSFSRLISAAGGVLQKYAYIKVLLNCKL